MYQLQDNHTKPSFQPLGKRTFEQLYMGVELEFEPKNQFDIQVLMDQIHDIFHDFAIMKQDNSLLNGFEICSRPASLEVHKEKWTPFFELVAPNLQTFFIQDKHRLDRCGMHVHINRQPLSSLQIGKMVAFIHHPKNYDFVKKIAGRASNEYCHYDFPREIKDAKPEYYRLLPKKVGVNLHHNETVEIRIFKSTTDIKTFFKNLEFCDALTRFTFPAHADIKGSIQYENFIKFLHETPEDYPNLIEFTQ